MRYGKFFESFRRVWTACPELTALQRLETLNPDRGCRLTFAADMICDLSHGLRKVFSKEITCHKGKVKNISRATDNSWHVDVDTETELASFVCERIILATGSHPRTCPTDVKQISLDDALQPSILASEVLSTKSVGVIGSSHSAMLVLKNLCELSSESEQPKKVVNFYRSPLKFAEYLPNDVIKHDNTGLKGEVAEWVRANLFDCDHGAPTIDCLDGKVERINLASYSNEKEAYDANSCDVIISAIGYERNSLPSIVCDGIELPSGKNIGYDDNGFIIVDGKRLDGLQGCGIAFPQRVLDVDGTPELSVGFWKFIRYIDQIISPSTTHKQ